MHAPASRPGSGATDAGANAVERTLCAWIDPLSAALREANPSLAGVVADYAGEARFGAACIAADLARLPAGAPVLEIGAGACLLASAVQAAGYAVTAVEPDGEGFAHMASLRAQVVRYGEARGTRFTHVDCGAENLSPTRAFAFSWSVNVMEHVADIGPVLQAIWAALAPGGAYRFVCPNYAFPFEPHFGIPTLGTKALTWRVFRRRILASPTVMDPAGTWRSLNWISVGRVRRVSVRLLGVRPEFDRGLLLRFLDRAIGDASFRRRHAALTPWAESVLAAPGARAALSLLPAALQPAMSCRLVRLD